MLVPRTKRQTASDHLHAKRVEMGALRCVSLLLLFAAGIAHAQRVVVLEFEGDRKGKLRGQVEAALKKAGVVELVAINKYKQAATRKKLRPNQQMTPAGVAKLSRGLGLDAAVEGSIGTAFRVRILDSAGQELWAKDLKLRAGLLSAEHARKLARAIATAAGAAEKPTAKDAEPPAAEPEKVEPSPESTAPSKEPSEDRRAPPTPFEGNGTSTERPVQAQPVPHVEPEPIHDADMEEEHRPKAQKIAAQPPILHLQVTGTTTWRSYCSRPGVESCKQYDDMPEGQRPPGDTVQFSPQVPYAGVAVALELMPLARLGAPLRGLGILAGYSRAWSLTNVHVESASGETPDKQVVSVDESYHAMLAYRYLFTLSNGRAGFVGARGGYMSKTFDVDPNAQVPLPGSHRRYPGFGIDVAVPVLNWLRLEASGLYFLSPKAGADEISSYGNPTDVTGGAVGQGFGVEGGGTADVWGPLGLVLKLRYSSYTDTFVGQGQKWQNGGAAHESYVTLFWGVTLSL